MNIKINRLDGPCRKFIHYGSTFTSVAVIKWFSINVLFFKISCLQFQKLSKVLEIWLTLLLIACPKAWLCSVPEKCKIIWHFSPHLNCKNFRKLLFLVLKSTNEKNKSSGRCWNGKGIMEYWNLELCKWTNYLYGWENRYPKISAQIFSKHILT